MPIVLKNENELFVSALQMIKSFKIDPWEFRGIGIHFELVPKIENNCQMNRGIQEMWRKRHAKDLEKEKADLKRKKEEIARLIEDTSDESDGSEDGGFPKGEQVPPYLLDRMFRSMRGESEVIKEFVKTNVRKGKIPIALFDLLILRRQGRKIDEFLTTLKIELLRLGRTIYQVDEELHLCINSNKIKLEAILGKERLESYFLPQRQPDPAIQYFL